METWTPPLIPIKNGIHRTPFRLYAHVPQNDFPLFSIVIEICVASIVIDSSICAQFLGAAHVSAHSSQKYDDKKAMNRPALCLLFAQNAMQPQTVTNTLETMTLRFYIYVHKQKPNCLLQSYGMAIVPIKTVVMLKWNGCARVLYKNYHLQRGAQQLSRQMFWKETCNLCGTEANDSTKMNLKHTTNKTNALNYNWISTLSTFFVAYSESKRN